MFNAFVEAQHWHLIIRSMISICYMPTECTIGVMIAKTAIVFDTVISKLFMMHKIILQGIREISAGRQKEA
ncbi:hypothetical protein D3C86_1120590 [compost metagenome]